ncbi:lantibiotic dehydratase [Streptomyces sp. NPDC088846]|uniref:lantibiotic dehydratase n=1 Tax=Streptomyces sp. NPDC088846 TaxID=3365908 RepID=UPI0037F8C2A5
MGSGRPRFRAHRTLLVRAVLHPGLPGAAWPDLADTTPVGVRSWCTWMRETWRTAGFADAVRHASPDLARALDALASPGAHPLDAATARRLVLSLTGYTLRAAYRTMPFGLFSGVAEGVFGSRTHVDWGTGHRAVARTDGRWLADLVRQLEAVPEIRNRLHLLTNNAVEVRGSRLVVVQRPHGSSGTELREVSLRHTAEVRTAVASVTAFPVVYQDLVRVLTAAHPGMGPSAARDLLDVLLDSRVLISSLQSPGTVTDALGHLLTELERAGADRIEQTADLVESLHRIHALMDAHNRQPAPAGAPLRAELYSRMREHSPATTPLAIDLHLDASLTVPRAVAWEAENAMEVLARTSPEPHGTVAWVRYRDRFQRRYGSGVLVPLLDLVNPGTGLGLPEDFLGTPRAPHSAPTCRDRTLLALAQLAVAEGREIKLDDSVIEQLSVDVQEPADVPPHVEMLAEVHAASAAELDEGRFRIAVRRTSRGWAHLAGGRFAAMLAEDDSPSDLLGALARRPTRTRGALPVQLSFPPLNSWAAHITRTPRLVAPVISLSEHRAAGRDVIPLSDLAVTHHDTRLHLVSRSRGMDLEAATPHPLHLECHTPALARFLDELVRGQCARVVNQAGNLAAWDWGAARHLPLWPRVRYGRSILSPATWNLAHSGLPGKDASAAQWEDAVTALRKRWLLPATVYLEFFDHRLRLSLDEPAHLAVLRAQFDQPRPLGQLRLTEAEPDDAFGWCGRRSEIVTLLASTASARPAAPVRTMPVHGRDSTHLPGASPYLNARLFCQPQARRALLAEHVPVLLTSLGKPTWWASHDNGDSSHTVLTVRLPGTAAAAGATRALGQWAKQLVGSGVLGDFDIAPYRPHLGQWGTGDALRAAENVLASDARVHVHQLAAIRGLDTRALTAANLLAIASGFWGCTADGLAWLAAQPKPRTTQPLPRNLPEQTRLLVSPGQNWPGLRDIPGGRDLADLWRQRHTALGDYRSALEHIRTGPDSDTALRGLLDAHLYLAQDTPSTDATSWHLARSVALAASRSAGRRPA